MLLFVACAATITLTACRKSTAETDGISVQQEISPQPARIGPATVTIRLTDTAAKPVQHAHIMVEADMTHPGMSPIFVSSEETAPGLYQARIDFNMGGDWVILSHIELANGHKLERQMDVKGVIGLNASGRTK
jgi:hypothetical protein